jgi:hypothetical protein
MRCDGHVAFIREALTYISNVIGDSERLLDDDYASPRVAIWENARQWYGHADSS